MAQKLRLCAIRPLSLPPNPYHNTYTWYFQMRHAQAATYGFTIFFGSTTRSNSASVTKPNFNAAAFNVKTNVEPKGE